MIRARILYPNGDSAMRQGTIIIEACLAKGCRIVQDPANRIPDGMYDSYMVKTEPDTEPQQQVKRGPGRPRKSER